MSCPNFTSPVNIPTIGKTCLLKCNYSYNYPYSELNVKNNGDHISLRFNPIQNTPVEYGNSNYNIEEVRIYKKSLHTYIGEYADAEMIIIHRNNMDSNKLFVCIPLMESSEINDNSIVLDNVLSEIGKRANSNNMQTRINLVTFNLNKFIPKKPFITYNGTQPFTPCDSNRKVNYIVFEKDYSIKITQNSMNLLNKILKDHNYTIKDDPKNGFYFNKNGPTSGTVSNEDIYIECKPTGSDGEILVPIASTWAINIDDMTFLNNGIIQIILGIIIMYFLIKIMKYIFSYMKSDTLLKDVSN